MNIKVNKDIIVQGLDVVYGAINERSTLPVLSNFLIDASKNKLQVTATNLDIAISCVMPGDCFEEGAITIPAKRFFEIVKQIPEDEFFVVSKKNNIIIIEYAKNFFKIIGLPKEEFPKIPDIQDGITTTINHRVLKNMLNLTSFAASHDESRYVLNGILFVINKDGIALVATDGRRLSISSNTLRQKEPSTEEKRFIIPTKTTYELNRLLKDDGDIEIVFQNSQAVFKMENITINSRLIEGEFPSYESVIPKKIDGLKINREQFVSSIRRASIFTTADSLGIKLELSKNRLIISKQSPDVGEAKEELAIEYNGPELSVGFNPHYLIDVLKNLRDDEIEFEINGPDKPGVIRTEGYIYIVLPMQL